MSTVNRWISKPLNAALVIALSAFQLRLEPLGNPHVHIDEEFYLLVGARMLEGALPYVDIWDRKPIGLFLIYAFAALFGDGVLAYQILAMACVIATALVLHRMALRLTDAPGALLVALAYPVWLNCMEGMGGQAPIFYNLPVALAAQIVMGLWAAPSTPVPRALVVRGALAMLLIGVAIQIKYTAAGEGMFFGLALLMLALRRHGLLPAAGAFLLWVGCALLPTGAALATYAAMGHSDAFLFANFLSIAERGTSETAMTLKRLRRLATILVPLLAIGLIGQALFRRLGGRTNDPHRLFVIGWALAALVSLLAFGTYFKHYGLALMPSFALLLALVPPQARRLRWFAVFALLVAAVMGGHAVHRAMIKTGDKNAIQRLVAAMPDRRNCPYVYDGSPAIYHLGHFCLPTRFPFPSHFRSVLERNALGIDSASELQRILATRPVYIVVQHSGFLPDEDMANRALIRAALERDYVPSYRERQGDQSLVVYRLRSSLVPSPNAYSPPQSAGQTRPKAT